MASETQSDERMKERDESHRLSGNLPVDDTYWGRKKHGGKRGRDSVNKHTFVAMELIIALCLMVYPAIGHRIHYGLNNVSISEN